MHFFDFPISIYAFNCQIRNRESHLIYLKLHISNTTYQFRQIFKQTKSPQTPSYRAFAGFFVLERVTGLGPATFCLGSRRSTGWAKPAFAVFDFLRHCHIIAYLSAFANTFYNVLFAPKSRKMAWFLRVFCCFPRVCPKVPDTKGE